MAGSRDQGKGCLSVALSFTLRYGFTQLKPATICFGTLSKKDLKLQDVKKGGALCFGSFDGLNLKIFRQIKMLLEILSLP